MQPKRLEVLLESQAEIEQCRRLAAEISDPETAKRLLKLANELEQRLREVVPVELRHDINR